MSFYIFDCADFIFKIYLHSFDIFLLWLQDEKHRLFISLIEKPSHVQKDFF